MVYEQEDNLSSKLDHMSDITISSVHMDKYLKAKAAKANRPPLPEGWTRNKDENGRIITFDETGTQVCGALRRKKQCYCKRPPDPGRNRCYYHGGKSLRGVASPNFKTGMSSIDMPAQLAARYNSALNDSELLSMRSDVALYRARLEDQLSQLREGFSGEFFKKAREIYKELLKALQEEDGDASRRLMRDLGHVIDSGYKEEKTWDKIDKTVEQKRKLNESETKRLVQLNQMITTEELMLVLGSVVDSVKRHIRETSVLTMISQDIRRILDDRGLTGKK